MVPTASNCPAFVGKVAIRPGTVAIVESAADLLASGNYAWPLVCVVVELNTEFAWQVVVSPVVGGPCLLNRKGCRVAHHTRMSSLQWPGNKVCFVPGHCLTEGIIVFNANTRRVGGKQLGYDGLVLYQLRRCLGSSLDVDGQEYVPGFHPGREINHAPLARLSLPHALPPQLQSIGTFLNTRTQKAIKVSKFTFATFLDQVLGRCGRPCWEGGDQEFLEAVRMAAAMTAVAPTSGPV